MSRRKRDSTVLDGLYAYLLEVPVWAGPILAMIVFATLRWLAPWFIGTGDPDNLTSKTLSTIVSGLAFSAAPWVSGVVLLLWVFAEFNKWTNRRQLDTQTGIESIRKLSWREFESLLSEAFRRQGYQVQHTGGASPDGGIDLRLTKAGEVTLVQCKHWRKFKVGVKVVRELLGVVTSEGAAFGIVIASGNFTADAEAFAARNPIRLINGPKLAEMVHEVQSKPASRPTSPPSSSASTTKSVSRPTPPPAMAAPHAKAAMRSAQPPAAAAPAAKPASRPVPPPTMPTPSETPVCPTCGATMILRTARKGATTGSQFWGCSQFPQCRGIRQLAKQRA